MEKERYIDVKIQDVEKNATIEFFQTNFSFSMNVGKLNNITTEDENILLFQFDKGEIRIELSLNEFYTVLNYSKNH